MGGGGVVVWNVENVCQVCLLWEFHVLCVAAYFNNMKRRHIVFGKLHQYFKRRFSSKVSEVVEAPFSLMLSRFL